MPLSLTPLFLSHLTVANPLVPTFLFLKTSLPSLPLRHVPDLTTTGHFLETTATMLVHPVHAQDSWKELTFPCLPFTTRMFPCPPDLSVPLTAPQQGHVPLQCLLSRAQVDTPKSFRSVYLPPTSSPHPTSQAWWEP